MYSRILNCDYEFVSPWWDEVSLNAKDLVSVRIQQTRVEDFHMNHFLIYFVCNVKVKNTEALIASSNKPI